MKTSEITPQDFDDLSDRLARGDITTASKQDLERFTVMLCRPEATTEHDRQTTREGARNA